MSVAYHYGNCYWNASGEFECLGKEKTMDKKVMENNIKKIPNQIPQGEYYNFVQPTNNYAKVPVQYLNNFGDSIETYQNRNQCNINNIDPLVQRTDHLSPLSREIEVSIYLPDREHQFPWDPRLRKDQLSPEQILKPTTQDFATLYPLPQPISQSIPQSISHQAANPIAHSVKMIQSPSMTSNQYIQSNTQTNLKNSNLNKLTQIQTQPIKSIQTKIKPIKSIQTQTKSIKSIHTEINPIKVWAPSHSADNQTRMSPYIVRHNKISKKNITWNQNSKYFNQFRTKVNKYYFQLPCQKYHELTNELGSPSLINPKKGGIAIWQANTLKKAGYPVIKRIDLIDEQCFNHFPYPHIGFLYTYVKIIIPMNKIGNVLSLCGDIMYDPIKRIMVVRGMTLNYNIALIAIICLYINGKITWYNIIGGNLVKQVLSHHQLINRKVQKHNLAIINKYLIK